MTQLPATSITLLKALSGESDSARWTEFFRKYEGPMRAFLAARYPSVEADDVIQETLKALAKRLPNYHYVPDEKGHFHNYLMGIVRHKADDAIRAQAREAAKLERFKAAGAGVQAPAADVHVQQELALGPVVHIHHAGSEIAVEIRPGGAWILCSRRNHRQQGRQYKESFHISAFLATYKYKKRG